jgi:hypothetical protein
MIITPEIYEYNGQEVNRMVLGDDYYCLYDETRVLQLSYEPVTGVIMSKDSMVGSDDIAELLEWVTWMGLEHTIISNLL